MDSVHAFVVGSDEYMSVNGLFRFDLIHAYISAPQKSKSPTKIGDVDVYQ